MWFLKNQRDEIIYVQPNRRMVFGRKTNCDIVLTDDTSISKAHATLFTTPKDNFKPTEPCSTLTIKDSGSKYGTFIVNDGKFPQLRQEECTLKDSDRIRFGLQHHIFTVHHLRMVVGISTLTVDEKMKLQDIVDALDIAVVDGWKSYCTHLTVSNATLTSKVVHALAYGTPIVNMEYWATARDCFQNNQVMPDPKHYVPVIKEGLLDNECVSLAVNPKRQYLFKNLLFLYLSDSQRNLEKLIQYAGGTLKYYEMHTRSKSQLCASKTVVLQPASDSSQESELSEDSYNFIQRALREGNRRMIPESEISLAILNCSIEKYCNPNFHFEKLFPQPGMATDISNFSLRAADTEDISFSPNKSTKMIPETATSYTDSQSKKQTQRTELVPLKPATKKRTRDDPPDSDHSFFSNITSNTESNDKESSDKSSRFDRFDAKRSKCATSSLNNLNKTIIPDSLEISHMRSTNNSIPRSPVSCQSTQSSTPGLSSSKRVRGTGPTETSNCPISIKTTKSETSAATKNATTVNPFISAINTRTRKRTTRYESSDDDLFSFVDDEPKKPKKGKRVVEQNNDMFSFVDEPIIKTEVEEENIFRKTNDGDTVGIRRNKRKPSVSSNDSVPINKEDIKAELSDGVESDWGRVLQTNKNDWSNQCDSSILKPLLRTDIDISLDTTLNLKSFVKVYDSIPQTRIKIKDMYVWEPDFDNRDVFSKFQESENDSEEDCDPNFSYASNEAVKSMRVKS